ncbi:MAG: hypothetical protein L7F78_10295 [Syntrophales bacterium LBB04]|nr:hypothetical protein [Syntrophales bacterium LBB04]
MRRILGSSIILGVSLAVCFIAVGCVSQKTIDQCEARLKALVTASREMYFQEHGRS